MDACILICFLVGIIIVGISVILMNNKGMLDYLFRIFCFGILVHLSSYIMMGYVNYKVTHSQVIVTNLGVGRVIRLEGSPVSKYSSAIYTVIKLNNNDYRCYGYIPDAKNLLVIEYKNVYTSKCNYNCELPE